MFKNNLLKLREKMNENNIDLAVITDDDNLYYFTGYHDFLHMDFNRPTILLVPKDDESTLITPLLDVLLVPENTPRSEEHTSELQSQAYLVCRLLLEKKKQKKKHKK